MPRHLQTFTVFCGGAPQPLRGFVVFLSSRVGSRNLTLSEFRTWFTTALLSPLFVRRVPALLTQIWLFPGTLQLLPIEPHGRPLFPLRFPFSPVCWAFANSPMPIPQWIRIPFFYAVFELACYFELPSPPLIVSSPNAPQAPFCSRFRGFSRICL